MNWILANLEAALDMFSNYMSQIYDVIMVNPQTYQEGQIWHVADKIYDAILGPAISIMVILFFMGLCMDMGEFIKTKRMNHIIASFVAMFFMSGLLYGGKYFLVLIFEIIREIIESATNVSGANFISLSWIEIPEAVKYSTEGLNLKNGVIFWIVTLIVALLIMVTGFTVLLVVFGRLFKIYMHVAIAPLAIATVVSRQTRGTFVAYVKSFVGVCIEGLVIVVALMIFSAFASNFKMEIPTNSYVSMMGKTEEEVAEITQNMTEEEKQQFFNSVVSAVNGQSESTKAYVLWTYLSQMVFLYLIMCGTIKGADTWVHQKLNL